MSLRKYKDELGFILNNNEIDLNETQSLFFLSHGTDHLPQMWMILPLKTLDLFLTSLDRVDKNTFLKRDTNCDLKGSRNAKTRKLKQVYTEFQNGTIDKTCTGVATDTSDNGIKRISRPLIYLKNKVYS